MRGMHGGGGGGGGGGMEVVIWEMGIGKHAGKMIVLMKFH